METLRQLQHVVALAERRHFGRAAETLGITQAALTQSIQKLEVTYGVSLFERRYGDATLTPYGEAVYEAARATVSKVQNLRREIDLMRKMASGRLIVGCDSYFADSIVAPALIRLLDSYPKLQFTLQLGGWEDVAAGLLAKDIDLYIGFAPETLDPNIALDSYLLPRLVTFCRPGHPLAGRTRLSVEETLRFPSAVPPPSQWLLQKFELFFQRAGYGKPLPHYLITADLSIIKQFVRSSDTVGMGLRRAVQKELDAGTFSLFEIDELNFEIPLVVARAQRRSLPPSAQSLLNEIRAEIQSFRDEA